MKWQRICKTPTVIQMEAVECGAASLAMILAFYGRYVSLAKLREDCNVSRDGSRASDILEAAKSYGLDGFLYTSAMTSVENLEMPLILFWGFRHFVVLEGVRGGKYYLNDPASGERIVSEEDFKRNFTGIMLQFKPNADFKKGGEKPTMTSAIFRRLKGCSLSLVFLILTGVGLIIPGLLLPLFSKMFVDGYLSAHLQAWLLPLLAGMFITFVVQAILMALQNYYLTRLEIFLSLKMGGEFVFHVLKLPLEFFNLRSAGDITQRFTTCNTLAGLISVYLLATLLSLFTALFYLLLMSFYSVNLALIGTGITLLNVMVMILFTRRQININRNLAVDQGHLFSLSVNGLNSIETYKAIAAEEDLFSQWAGFLTRVQNGNQAAQRLSQILFSFNSFIVSFNLIITLGLGGYFIIKGEMSLGMLVAFQSLLIGFMQPFNQLVRINAQLQQAQGNLMRVDDVLTYPVRASKKEVSCNKQSIIGDLKLKNVVFGYNKGEPPLFDNLNLELAAGKSIGIIGPSRCGGSTLLQLIAGLYEPWSGEILLDHVSRNEYSDLLISHYVSFVGQTSHLFDGTVYDNITMWSHDIPQEQVILAAKAACIHNVIAKRDGAYHSIVLEEGGNFSGGERQRIAIARALARNPSLLILDGATSMLDAPVEAEIYENIRKRGCTSIIVSHRLSSIRDCDEIIVMDQGKIIAAGNHETLIRQGGWYAQFAQ